MHFIYYLLFFFTGVAAGPNKSSSVPIPAGSTLNFTVYVHNNQEAKSNNSAQIHHAEVGNPESTSVLKKLADIKTELVHTLKETKDNVLSRYKWHLLAGTALASYASLCYICFSGNSYLSNSALWSSWHQELPLDQLLAIPQAQFAQDLLREIQRRYTDAGSLTDVVRPLTMFLKDIEQEEETIKWYQSWYSWIHYLKLDLGVPFSTKRFGQIPQRLQRIAYYKNVFHSWAAEYQLEHAQAQLKTIARDDEEMLDLIDTAKRIKFLQKIKMKDYLFNQQLNHIPKP